MCVNGLITVIASRLRGITVYVRISNFNKQFVFSFDSRKDRQYLILSDPLNIKHCLPF